MFIRINKRQQSSKNKMKICPKCYNILMNFFLLFYFVHMLICVPIHLHNYTVYSISNPHFMTKIPLYIMISVRLALDKTHIPCIMH